MPDTTYKTPNTKPSDQGQPMLIEAVLRTRHPRIVTVRMTESVMSAARQEPAIA